MVAFTKKNNCAQHTVKRGKVYDAILSKIDGVRELKC